MGIEVTVARLDQMEALAAAWCALERRSQPSFFRTWTWIGCWLAETGIRPWVVQAAEAGRVIGLGLLCAATRRRHGWLSSRTLLLHETGEPGIDGIYTEYNGLLAEIGREEEVAAAVIEHLLADVGLSDAGRPGGGPGRWEELRLGGVGLPYLDLARRTGLEVEVVARQPSAAVDLDGVRESRRGYLESLGTNTRQQLRRSLRLYEARGPLTVEAADTPERAETFLGALAELHQRSWRERGRAGAFAAPFFGRFHRRLIHTGLPQGAVELLRVAAGAETVGYLYNFRRGGWVGNYASGLVYDDDPKLKPGLVCFHLAVERHLALGNAIFDFMAGGQRYKANLGSPGPELYWIELRRPSWKFRLEAGLRRCRDLVLRRPVAAAS